MKKKLFKSLTDGDDLSSGDVRKCKETTALLKGSKKIIECKKKGILNLAYKLELIFENRKTVKKVSKARSGNVF